MKTPIKHAALILLSLLIFQLCYSQSRIGISAKTVFPKDILYGGLYFHEKVSYAFGLFDQIHLGSIWLQPELQYSPERFDYFTSGQAPVISKFINLHVPVLMGFSPIKRLNFLFGPELTFVYMSILIVGKTNRLDMTKYSNRWRKAVVMDINFCFANHFGLTGRYKYNFSNSNTKAYNFKYGEYQGGLFYVFKGMVH